MDSVFFSRMLTELTLAFHIIFATIGVGVPVMIALAQWIGVKNNDPHYLLLARRWSRGFVITVAVGVVTGTAIGLQLSLLWPKFMELAGQVIGLPLFLETFAFFIEAIFLGIYMYTWDRVKNPKLHLLLLVPVAIGGSMSAVFITTVNAFMNTPSGFDLVDGQLVNINPWEAMFNPATATKVAHVLTTSYMTSAFILAAIAAYHLLKGKRHVYYKKALRVTMIAALVFSVATAVAGDFAGKFLAKYQPEKLAAAEWHFETEKNAPLVLFGTLNEENQVESAIKIPSALSILAYGTPDGEVIGLNEFPKEEQPPLYIHYLFDLMVVIGIALTIVAFLYVLFERKKPQLVRSKLFLSILIGSAPLAMLAIEIGWFFTEVGRQPWIIRGLMKVSEAATTSDDVGIFLGLFAILYTVLTIACLSALHKLFKNKPAEKELQ